MSGKAAVINRIQNKLAEQTKLLAVLDMWAKVEAQGINPDDVVSFTWLDSFITPAQGRERRKASFNRKPDPFTKGAEVLQYNAVRLTDNSFKQLDPIIPRP